MDQYFFMQTGETQLVVADHQRFVVLRLQGGFARQAPAQPFPPSAVYKISLSELECRRLALQFQQAVALLDAEPPTTGTPPPPRIN